MKLYDDIELQDVEPVEYKDIPYGNMVGWHYAVDAVINGAKFYFDRQLTTMMKKHLPEKEQGKLQVRVADIPMGFDIETTTVVDRNAKGKVISARGYMYYACVGIGDVIVHCRKWDEVVNVFEYFTHRADLGKERKTYTNNGAVIHLARVLDANFGFEFSFMHKHMKWENNFMLASSAHDVIYALTTDGLLFQDPLKISNSSLEELAKMYHLPTQKTHDLDYNIPRNSKTPLKPEEKHYVSCDVRILLDFARWCHINYTKNGLRIPLTQTAMLRDTIKKYYEDYRKGDFDFVHNVLPKLFPANVNVYTALTQQLFRGGYTHANITAIGHTFYAGDDVNSWDIDSSYIYSILCQKFPMGEFTAIAGRHVTVEKVKKLADSTAFMMHITFKGLQSLSDLSLESISKTDEYIEAGRDYKRYTIKAGAIVDGGRIRYADKCTVWLTELDFLNYCKFYTWKEISFGSCYFAPKALLPEYVRLPLMYKYLRKCELKAAGKKGTTEYNVEKAGLNSGFGLMVEKLKLEKMCYNNSCAFKSDKPTEEQIKGKEDLYYKRLSKIYHDKVFRCNKNGEDLARNPLSPFWGIWVSANARHNLLAVCHMIGDDHLYCDTDSVYCKKSSMYYNVIAKYNDIVRDTTRIVLSKWNSEHPEEQFDFEMFKNLGTFGVESVDDCGCPISYSRFLTLGAKKYLKENYKGEVEQVLAGLTKGVLQAEADRRGKDVFAIFNSDLKIKNAKKCCTYIDKPTADCITDIYGNSEIMSEESSVAIFDVDFSFGLNSDFVALLMQVLKEKERQDYLKPVVGVKGFKRMGGSDFDA